MFNDAPGYQSQGLGVRDSCYTLWQVFTNERTRTRAFVEIFLQFFAAPGHCCEGVCFRWGDNGICLPQGY
ncbi:MAG: hypothetical protein PHI97_13395 [Desulfobulbus sp.]|nr:hypothetical protein [Desulfobulbus sp.]